VGVFRTPGLKYEALVSASAFDGHSSSFWRRDVAPGDTISPSLLAPPVPDGPLSLIAGSRWLWRPVDGADTYRVSVAPVSPAAGWDAASALPRITLPVGVPVGPADVRIMASTQGGLRSISSLAGPRHLALWAVPEIYSAWEGSAQ
jgi:hypothetical protein